MKLIFKKLLSVGLAFLILFSANITTFADENINVKNNSEFVVRDISIQQVPENIQLTEFNSMDEAYEYLLQIDKEINMAEKNPIHKLNLNSRYTTNGIIVDTTKVGAAGKVYLKMNCSVSGKEITSVDPYTELTGFTLGFDWTETSIGYSLKNNNQAVYVYASGTVDYYFIVNGTVKLGSRSVSLDGTIVSSGIGL